MNPLQEFVEKMCVRPLHRTPGNLYLIGGAGLVKIGRTEGRVVYRLRDLQTGSPVPLRIIALTTGLGWAEAILHRKFSRARRHGEWFDPAACCHLRVLVGECEAYFGDLQVHAEIAELFEEGD